MKQPRKEVCDCGLLERWSREPEHPIGFDAELNEYYIAVRDGRETSMIYYCPFCGGRAPESRRDSLFAHVSNAEHDRISSLFVGIRTESDVIEKFGDPDEEHDVGEAVISPEKQGQPSRGEVFRTITYRNLSPVANVVFRISDGGRAIGTWVQKHIEETTGQQS